MRITTTALSLAATACLGALTVFAATRAAALRGAPVPAAAAAFRHPGVLNSRADLDNIKANVKAGAQPWKSAYDKLREPPLSRLDYVHKAFVTMDAGNGDNKGSNRYFQNDAHAAYSHALQWVVTGDKAHADKSRAILLDWAKTNTTLTTDLSRYTGKYNNKKQHVLVAAQYTYIYVAAAEILRHYNTNSGWSNADTVVFSSWLTKTLYPAVTDIPPCKAGSANPQCADYKGKPGYVGRPVMGNGPAGPAMMAVGVFTNDRTRYNAGKAFWEENCRRYINPPDDTYPGMLAEICRSKTPQGDKKHSEMGVIQLVIGAEIGHQQNDDLYGYLDNRLVLGLEWMAALYNGQGRGSWCIPAITPASATAPPGDLLPGWAMAYNHYHNRRGLNLPWTKKIVDRTTPESYRWNYLGWTTLTHSQGREKQANLRFGAGGR